MGMGYTHTSNIAQRFAIIILILWYEEFARLDTPFLELESSRNSALKAMLANRRAIPEHKTQQHQDRLHAGHFFSQMTSPASYWNPLTTAGCPQP